MELMSESSHLNQKIPFEFIGNGKLEFKMEIVRAWKMFWVYKHNGSIWKSQKKGLRPGILTAEKLSVSST